VSRRSCIRLTFTVAFACILTVWVISAKTAIVYDFGACTVLVGGGMIKAGVGPGRWFDNPGIIKRVSWDFGWKWPFFGRLGPNHVAAEIPFWLITLIIVGPLILFSCRRPPILARNICRSCGYSLKGNMTGICPECGLPISDIQKRSVRPG
jgi:hypothetical protein